MRRDIATIVMKWMMKSFLLVTDNKRTPFRAKSYDFYITSDHDAVNNWRSKWQRYTMPAYATHGGLIIDVTHNKFILFNIPKAAVVASYRVIHTFSLNFVHILRFALRNSGTPRHNATRAVQLVSVVYSISGDRWGLMRRPTLFSSQSAAASAYSYIQLDVCSILH